MHLGNGYLILRIIENEIRHGNSRFTPISLIIDCRSLCVPGPSAYGLRSLD